MKNLCTTLQNNEIGERFKQIWPPLKCLAVLFKVDYRFRLPEEFKNYDSNKFYFYMYL